MHFSNKKSYCELCQNNACSDLGKRNIHFMANNQCSRFYAEPSYTNHKVIDILDAASKKKVPLYQNIDTEIPRLIKAYNANDNSFIAFGKEIAENINILLQEYSISRKIFKIYTSQTSGVSSIPTIPIRANQNFWATDSTGNINRYNSIDSIFQPQGFSNTYEMNFTNNAITRNTNKINSTLLSDLFLKALEEIFLRENTIVKTLLTNAREKEVITKEQISPTLLLQQVTKRKAFFDVVKVIAGRNVLQCMLANKDFKWEFNNKEEIENGSIGNVQNGKAITFVLTDAHLPKTLRFLEDNDLFIIYNRPGAISIAGFGGITAQDITEYSTTGVISRSFYLTSEQAIALMFDEDIYKATLIQ